MCVSSTLHVVWQLQQPTVLLSALFCTDRRSGLDKAGYDKEGYNK